LIDITILDRLQLFDGQDLQGEYQEYVEKLILAEVLGSGESISKPILRTPVTVNKGVQQQLESRGVYLDTVYDLDGKASTKYMDYLAAVQNGEPANPDRLEKVPFSEVNLTLLSNWSSAQSTLVSVASEPVATIADPDNDYYGTYRRGWISALDETETAGVEITTTIRPNNDGFTQLDIEPDVVEETDAIMVKVEGEGSPFTISGTYEISFPLGNTKGSTTIHLTPAGSGSCSLPGSPGNTYECSVNSPWSGSIQLKTEVTSGPRLQRCSGESETFVGNGLSGGGDPSTLVHDFNPFSCD
jgi:hypothetical protein